MKRILAIMLVVILLISVVSCGKNPTGVTGEDDGDENTATKYEYQAAGSADKFEYAVNDEGNYEITDFSSTNAALHTVTIPAEIGGIPVTGIADEAFKAANQMNAVVIPASVKYIGTAAFFGCEYLATVAIPNSVTEIGMSAFEGCASLASVTLSNTLKEIASGAFALCTALESVTFTESVEVIDKGAFLGCTALTEIVFSASVKELRDTAFYGCTALESVEIPATVLTFGKYVFHAGNENFKVIAPANTVASEYAAANGYGYALPGAAE